MSKSAASSPYKSNAKITLNSPTPKTSTICSPYSTKSRPATSFFEVGNYNSIVNKQQVTYRQQKQQTDIKLSHNRDVAVSHQVKTNARLSTCPDKKCDIIKRNPILQDNNEETAQFKPSVKRLASAEKVTPCYDENITRGKKKGDYNYVVNPPCQDPKPSGIRKFESASPVSDHENRRRVRKEIQNLSQSFNPITEGDVASESYRRSRKAVEKTEDNFIQKLNDRKHILSSDRGISSSPRGKLFRDTQIAVVGTDWSKLTPQSARPRTASEEPLTAFDRKIRGEIKDTIQYAEIQNFKDYGITGKCNTRNFNEVVKTQPSEFSKSYGRKKLLEYN